jgi:hypothetical protein
MDHQSLGRKIITLSVISVVGIVYSGFLYFQPTLTGRYVLDGIIGVVLGLYISSDPAANLVDILFYRRAIRNQFPSKRSLVLWLFLNVLVLFISGIVIFAGTTRLIGRGDRGSGKMSSRSSAGWGG